MSPEKEKVKNRQNHMPGDEDFFQRLKMRHQRGTVGKWFNFMSIMIAILALIALFGNVANEAFGTIGVVNTIEPEALTDGRPLEDLSNQELVTILADNVGGRLRVLIRDSISQVPTDQFTTASVADIVGDTNVDPEIADMMLKDITPEQQASLLAEYASTGAIRALVLTEVVEQQIIASFTLSDTIFNFDVVKAQIEGPILEDYKEAQGIDEDLKVEVIRFYSWLDSEFISTPMSSTPALAGIRTALIGSIGLMIVVIMVALPVGVGAAIYLEEYANDSLVNRIIETNVRNLAGVPSIIYGMLGLAIFVRALAPFTSGLIFQYNFDVPTPDQIVNNRLAPILDDAIAIDEDGTITNNSALSDEELGAVIDTFLYYGTPTLTMMGSVDVRDLTNSMADALNTTVDVSNVSSTEDFDIEIRGTYYAFDIEDGAVLDRETFDELMASLVRINAFSPNGRTLVSAGLTLVLLILPIIIINSQEAIRAVPYAIREASYGLGATRWQTIWNQVLPAALPGIMTGTILSVSRAVGETAPLIVVGAATFLVTDPTSPFSQFTAMPIQIYQWTARPQGQFADIAAAAIIVLLALMLTLNAIAIVLRNRYAIKY
jgi:ABC-type phosphate transport system permease subunit